MPPLPNVPNCIRHDSIWTVGADTKALTRLHWLSSGGPPSGSTLNTLAGDIMTDAAASLPAIMGTDTALDETILTDISSSTGAQGTSTAAVAGTRAGGILPANAAVLVNYPIARRYRGGKPRSYFPWGVDSDLASAQTWTSGFLAAVHTAYQTWLSAIEGHTVSGFTLTALVSIPYYHGFVAITNPITGRTRDVPKVVTGTPIPDVITATNVNPKVGSQRRRTLHQS